MEQSEIEVKMAQLEASCNMLSLRVDQIQKELDETRQTVSDNALKIGEISEKLIKAQHDLETRITSEFAELKEMIQTSHQDHAERLADAVGDEKDKLIAFQQKRLEEVRSLKRGIITGALGVLVTTITVAVIKVIATTIAGG